jgi:hypothetical protein
LVLDEGLKKKTLLVRDLLHQLVATTGNRVFTESWKLRREPNLQLSVKTPSPRANVLTLGEGLAHGEQHLRRELSILSSRRRVRLTAPQPQPSRPPTSVKFAESLAVRLSAKKNTRRRNTFTESIIPSVSVLFLLTANFPKKIHIFESKLFS